MDIKAAFRDAITIESARRGFALGDGMGQVGNLRFKYDPKAAGPAKVPQASDSFKTFLASVKNAIVSSPAKREEMRQEAIFIRNLAQSGEVFGRVNANMRDPVAVAALAKSLDKMIARVPGEQQPGGANGVAAHWSHGLDLALGRLTSLDLSAVKSGLQELMTQPWYEKGENLTSNQRALLSCIKEKIDALTPEPRTETSALKGDPPIQAGTAQVELLKNAPSSLPPFPSPLNLSEKGGSVPTSPEMSSVSSQPTAPSPNAPPPPPPPPPPPLPKSPSPGASGGLPDAASRAQALHDEIGAAKLALKARSPEAPSPGPGPGSTFAEQAVAKLNSGGLRTAAESDKLAKQLAEKSAAKVAEAVKKSPLVTDSPEYKQKVGLLESIQQAGGSPKAAKAIQAGVANANAESGSASGAVGAATAVPTQAGTTATAT